MKWQEHHYGSFFRLVNSASLTSFVADISKSQTQQPALNSLVIQVYKRLLWTILDEICPTEDLSHPTRMTAEHPQAALHGTFLKKSQKFVTVNLARAGTLPSQLFFDEINSYFNPEGVRQDHIFAFRKTNEKDQVTGTQLEATKIGGSIDGAIVFFPDPMGATGNTIAQALDHFKKNIPGTPFKFVAVHLIVTPEYLKKLNERHPDVLIYAVRVDRGLSNKSVLAEPLGVFWDQEKGLNDKHYIVPGAGGLGELMNNSFV